MKSSLSFLLASCLAALPATARAQSTNDSPAILLDPVVVTAPRVGDNPLEIVIDAKAPAQPIPAQDGADILKTIPGFDVSRKGGTGGEVLLRGQAGSRIDLLLDGASVLGGCPFRMDPPTAYVFPGSFDHVTVIKGPETVLYGPGNSAGTVLFESDPPRFETPGATFDGSTTVGSFNRLDVAADVRAGTPAFFVQAGYTRTQSGDYEDGDGNKVHSQYDRHNVHASVGWTPDADTLLELTAAFSGGEAAYAGMSMDATTLDRRNLGLHFRKKDVSPTVSKVEARLSYNYVDHVMDDFRLRTPGMMSMGQSELDHRLIAGRALIELTPAEGTRITPGIDFQNGLHRSHDTGTWVDDAVNDREGVFAELRQDLASPRDRLIAGARVDRWSATDKRSTITTGMMTPPSPNPTAGETRTEALLAGFARYEHDLEKLPVTAYLGIGYTQRAPDYWELISYQGPSSISSFDTDIEKTTQLDTGLNYRRGAFTASVSAFANYVGDYILVQNNVPDGMGTKTVTRNVDATSWGGEAGASYAFAKNWKADASLAYVRGRNLTDDLPLAQQPPLEGRIGLVYSTPVWSAGGLLRLVAAQDEFATGQGTIAGQDLGRTGGFAVFSLNAGWRINKYATLTAGVDNLFDKAYAENVSRAGSAVAGYPTTTRVNEPGRTLWMKLAVAF